MYYRFFSSWFTGLQTELKLKYCAQKGTMVDALLRAKSEINPKRVRFAPKLISDSFKGVETEENDL